MRDLAHFAAGIAWASCFPQAIRAGAAGNPGYFILGAAAGLLPGVLKARFGSLFFRHDVEIAPDPAAPDPAGAACALASSVDAAASGGRPVGVRLHPVRSGRNEWLGYEVFFNVPARSVSVTFGPLRDKLDAPARTASVASSSAQCGFGPSLRLEVHARTTVRNGRDVVLLMKPRADGSVALGIAPSGNIPSRHLVPAALLGIALSFAAGPVAGAVTAGAFAMHALTDGGGWRACLPMPFARRRMTEPRRNTESSVWTATVVWLSALVVFWNLYSAGDLHYSALRVFRGVALAAAVPLLSMLALRRLPEGEREL